MNWEVFSLDWSFSQLFYSKLVLPQFRPVKRWKAWGRLDFESQFCHKVAERPHTSLFMIFLFIQWELIILAAQRLNEIRCKQSTWIHVVWWSLWLITDRSAFPSSTYSLSASKDKDYLIHSLSPRTSTWPLPYLEGLQKCCQSLNHFTKTLGARCFPEINFPIQNINMMYKLQLHVELPPTKSQVY